jgi:hypothetical protein
MSGVELFPFILLVKHGIFTATNLGTFFLHKYDFCLVNVYISNKYMAVEYFIAYQPKPEILPLFSHTKVVI